MNDGTAPAQGGRPGGDAELNALGPFFTVARHDPADPPTGTWRPASDIAHDPAVLDERVFAVREFLAAGSGLPAERIEVRVAASVAHLGMAARLTSPLLATAVLHGHVPRLTLGDLRRQDTLGGAFPLSLPQARGSHVPGTATDVAAVLLDGVAAPLAGAFGRFGVSDHILRGNTASALAGAGRMLVGAGAAAGAGPGGHGGTRDVRALVEGLLRHPFLNGAGAYDRGTAFRRRSCCLIYRAAPDRNGALCGDCALHRPAARTPS